jgi:hypothetical protein
LILVFKWHRSYFRYIVPARRLVFSEALNHVVCDRVTVKFLASVFHDFLPKLRTYLMQLGTARGRVLDVLTESCSHFGASLSVPTPSEPMPSVISADASRPMTASTTRSGVSLNFADLV